MLPYYGSRGNSKLFISPLHNLKKSIFNWPSNSILHVKVLFTCFYIIIDELSLDMHTLTDLSKLFLIYCMYFLLNLLSRCCSFHIFKSFVVNFTWSIFFYQLHKFFWNKKIFTGFIHKPSMNSQVKLGTNLIKWKKRISMINFGRNFVIFVKYLLAWHFCCLYFFFWYYKSMSENARKGYTSTLITATTSINLLKSVLTDHQ